MPNLPKETPPKICANPDCGKEFNRLMTGPGRKRPEDYGRYMARECCSRACKDYMQRTGPKSKICAFSRCGKEFTREDLVDKSHWLTQIYCSKECMFKGRRKNPDMTQVEAKKYKVSLRKKANQFGPIAHQTRAPRKKTTTIRFKDTRPVSEHVFPEGPRQEVWRPASWKK